MVIGNLKIRLDEAIAVAMMLGEPEPNTCQRCDGSGRANRLFGYAQCEYCDGDGFGFIGLKTREFFNL